MELEDKVAIVTGGAGGIGREIALTFAEKGASLVVADIDEEGLEAVLAEMNSRRGVGIIARADVARRQDVESAVDLAVTRFGKIDILAKMIGTG
jgi:NAD(P)-dependent dehydrogenase (short-subunit alcohol dehydrogenase family)